MKNLLPKYVAKLKCLFGRHEFLVRDSMMAKVTDIKCARHGCKFNTVARMMDEKGLSLAVELKLEKPTGIVFNVHRTDINRKILAIVYSRKDAKKQGQDFINLSRYVTFDEKE